MAFNLSASEKLTLSVTLGIPQDSLANAIEAGTWDCDYLKFGTLIDIAQRPRSYTAA